MEHSGQLHRSGRVTLDADGAGQIYFVTDNAWQRWEVTQVVVATTQTPTQTPVPQAYLYVNTPNSAGNQHGGSWSGSQDTFTGLMHVGPCDTLYVTFAGGIAGTTATAVVEGTWFRRG